MSPWVSEGLAKRPIRDVLIKHLVNLCRIFSPSGYELGVIEYCLPVLKESGFAVEVSPEGNIYAVRGKPESGKYLLLNAHTDTVQGDRDIAIMAHPDLVQFDPFWNVVWGHGHMVGGDDKCGIGIILALAESTQTPMKVLFTVREEAGCTGVNAVPKEFYSDVAFCFTLDRRNCCDLIDTYAGRKLAPKGLVNLILDIAKESHVTMRVAEGSFADTHAISEYVPSVNMSVGYYNAHSSYDFIRVNETYDTMMIVRKCFERQKDFEDEWAKTPDRWRPKLVEKKLYASYQDYYFGGGYYIGMEGGWDDYKDRVNYSINRYTKVETAKDRKRVQEGIKEEAKEEKKEEKREALAPEKYTPAQLVAKDDVEPELVDPFGSTYGDLIWAERYNSVWEDISAYPRVKIERKWAATYDTKGDVSYAKSRVRKEPRLIPSSLLVPAEGERLLAIVSDLITKYQKYKAPKSDALTHDYMISVHGPDPEDMKSGILGWMEFNAIFDSGNTGLTNYLPMLSDVATVNEIAMVYQDHPDSDLAYRTLNLSVDVSNRIEEESDKTKKFLDRTLSLDHYNAMIDLVSLIDRHVAWFKPEEALGKFYEASFTKQIQVDGWNSMGRVVTYHVDPTDHTKVAVDAALHAFEEEFFVYGDYASLKILRNLFYKKVDDRFDSKLDGLEKAVTEHFIAAPKYERMPVAKAVITDEIMDDIIKHMTFSDDFLSRKTGFPYRLRESARSIVLDSEQTDYFVKLLSNIGTLKLHRILKETRELEFRSKETAPAVLRKEREPDLNSYTKVTYGLSLHGEYVLERRAIVQPSMPIGTMTKTPIAGVMTSNTYHNTFGAVLDLYHEIGSMSYDWAIPGTEDHMEEILLAIEELITDVANQWYRLKMIMEEEGVTLPEEISETPPTIQKSLGMDEYTFEMPFFRKDGKMLLSHKDFVNFVNKYSRVQLTSEEISLLTAGITNYVDLLKTNRVLYTPAKKGEPTQEVKVIAYHIDPRAEVIASIGVLDPMTKEYIDGWTVFPTITGIATMYFKAYRLDYDSKLVENVVNYFNTIAFYVILRVKHGAAITYDHEKGGFLPPTSAEIMAGVIEDVKLKKRKTKSQRKAEKKAAKKLEKEARIKEPKIISPMIGADSLISRALSDDGIKLLLHEYLMDLTPILNVGTTKMKIIPKIKSELGNYLMLVTTYKNIYKVGIGEPIGVLYHTDEYNHPLFHTDLYLTEGSLQTLLTILSNSTMRNTSSIPIERLRQILETASDLANRPTPVETPPAKIPGEEEKPKREKKRKRTEEYRFDSTAYGEEETREAGRGHPPKGRRGSSDQRYSPP